MPGCRCRSAFRKALLKCVARHRFENGSVSKKFDCSMSSLFVVTRDSSLMVRLSSDSELQGEAARSGQRSRTCKVANHAKEGVSYARAALVGDSWSDFGGPNFKSVISISLALTEQ